MSRKVGTSPTYFMHLLKGKTIYMQKFNIAIKTFFIVAIAFLSFLPQVQAQQTMPNISGLVFGVVRDTCAPWDGAATEIILTPIHKGCESFEVSYPYLRIAINDQSVAQLNKGVYQIELHQQMTRQASFISAEGKFQAATQGVLTILSSDNAAQKLSGELQLTFADQHFQTVRFEAIICQSSQQQCG